MNNRINQKLAEESKILSIYFTAGYPKLEDTRKVMLSLQEAGVDMLEIGLPFSDPLADGPTIQQSSTAALHNGMSTQKLFSQLEGVRNEIHIPLIVMGYFNAMLQFGVEAFCKKCNELGIDGIIMPDLPLEIYQNEYKSIFKAHNLHNIFLITPQTSTQRIKLMDEVSNSFIYMVSTASTTGSNSGFGAEQMNYFERISKMNLKNKLIVGFGIKDQESFQQATKYTKGSIIGSAFIKHLNKNGVESIPDFVKKIRV
jgi:tryptophan synthase alpha chain